MPVSGGSTKHAVSIPLRQKLWISEYVRVKQSFSNIVDFIVYAARREYFEILELSRSERNGVFIASRFTQAYMDMSSSVTIKITWPVGLEEGIKDVCKHISKMSDLFKEKSELQMFRIFVVNAIENCIGEIEQMENFKQIQGEEAARVLENLRYKGYSQNQISEIVHVLATYVEDVEEEDEESSKGKCNKEEDVDHLKVVGENGRF